MSLNNVHTIYFYVCMYFTNMVGFKHCRDITCEQVFVVGYHAELSYHDRLTGISSIVFLQSYVICWLLELLIHCKECLSGMICAVFTLAILSYYMAGSNYNTL